MRDAPRRRYLRVDRAFLSTGPTVPSGGQSIDDIGRVAPGEVVEDAAILVVGNRIAAIGQIGRAHV